MYVYWKFPVKPDLRFEVLMPISADVKSVHMQGRDPQMWALVDLEEAEKVTRTFGTIPTGQEFECEENEDIEFIGTFMPEPGLVFHLVEFVQWEEDEDAPVSADGEDGGDDEDDQDH